MFTREELVGLVFKGYFQRDNKYVLASEEDNKKLRVEHPKIYEQRRKGVESANRQHSFEVRILDYNPESGMFVARGIDDLGDSGLVGLIFGEEIIFTKHYAGRVLEIINDSRFEKIQYRGRIAKPDNVITCGGSYHPLGIGAPNNFDGNWRLDSIPKK